jgi:protease-4
MMKSVSYLILSVSFALIVNNPALADNIDDSFNFNNTEATGYNSISTTDDSRSMIINPGGIGLKGDGEIFFSNSLFGSLQQTNLFGTYGNFNLGYQQFTPRGNSVPPMRKYIVGAGYPIFQGLSVGLSYFNIQSTDGSNAGASSIDFGLLTRPLNFLSLGFVIRNLTTPVFGKSQINRSYAGSIGIRPGGWDRLTVTLDGEWVENSAPNRIRGGVGLETEFIDGIILKGNIVSDATFKQFSWGLEAGFNFPYVSVGYGREFSPAGARDAGYAKISLNKGRTIFEAENSSFAEIDMGGTIRPNKDVNLGLFSVDLKNSVFDYIQTIDKAKNDKGIAGIILNMNNFSSGLAVNEEIREKLLDFKTSGKKVIAYIRELDTKDYYLATVADYIVMHPIGGLQLEGLASVHSYYKELLDKLGIEAQFEKIGKYKSAPEPLTRNSASQADKEQTYALLDDFYSSVSKAITENRKITEAELKSLIDNKLIIDATEAKDLKLVDQIAHYDEIPQIAAHLLKRERKFPLVDLFNRNYKKYNWSDDDQIAIINASGTIIEGSSTSDLLSGETTLGADTISAMLNRARRDDSIKAVVLRVDSGGGSALASDIIAREIARFKEEKKPIVISMANVAASGGYWLSAGADKIVADSNTITGSIGVFTGKLNFARLFDKLGISTESFKIGEHADYFSQARPFTEEERKILDKSIQSMYRIFLERVSAGRNIPIARVDEIGQGRVYSGKKAKELNLVDETGGLDKAIEIARVLAAIKDKKPEVFNLRPSGLDTLSHLAADPAQAFYPVVLMRLIKENRVLAIMPGFEF